MYFISKGFIPKGYLSVAASRGAWGGNVPQSEALPHLPPSQKKKNGQNQVFSANFWIFAPSESHFAPSMPTKKKKKKKKNSGAATGYCTEVFFFISKGLIISKSFIPCIPRGHYSELFFFLSPRVIRGGGYSHIWPNGDVLP